MKSFLTTIMAGMMSVCAMAQTVPATALKTPKNANPLCPYLYTADPTAVEYEGRLYVYGTNDTQQFNANNKTGGNGYGAIRSLVVLSTDDMVNWTYHGTIDAVDICGGGWCFCSWAPSIVSRVEEDGQTHFYLYFSNSGAGVGVLTSTSPTGPWTSPLSHALVDGRTKELGECSAPMDPGVVIDENGVGWLAFGGGGTTKNGTEWFPGNARIVKLGKDMVSLDSEPVEIKAPYHFEANELNYMGGKWVYTYCTTWAARNDWDKCGSTLGAPGLCTMCYMVSDTPLEQSSWLYKGDYFQNPCMFGYPGGNNHSHLQKYKDNYYFLYHTQWLEATDKRYDTGGFRCMAVNKASVGESNQKIVPVRANNEGVAQLKKVNPYVTQQAEMTATGAGIDYENLFNEGSSDTRVSHKNMVIGDFEAGAWTMVRGVDFGSEGATSFTARLKGKGIMEVRLDDINSEAIATVEFSSARLSNKTVEVDKAKLSGVHDVYFYFPEVRIPQFDEWSFSNAIADGISEAKAENNGKAQYFDLAGRKIKDARKGEVVIVKKNGYTKKVMR